MDKSALISEVKKRRDELVQLTQALVRIKTENPPCDMTEIAGFAEAYFRDAGIPVQRYEPVTGRISLIATLQGKGPRKLAFNGHLDVVPAGNLSTWRVDPYGGEIIDGELWGRGSADMKSKIAAAMVLARILKEKDMPLPGSWTVMLVPDEETGGEDGTKWLVEQNLVQADAVIVGEGAGRHYGVANKGSLGVDLKLTGRSAHAARPFEGDNAVERLAALLPRFRELESWEPDLPAEVREIIELSRPFHEENAKKRNVPVDLYLWSLGHTTVNVGTFRGGTKRNVVADTAVAELDLRYPPGVTGGEVRAQVEKLLQGLKADGLTMEVAFDFEPFYQDVKAEIVQISINALRELGICAEPYPVFKGSFNDCRHLQRGGIPSVVLGHDGSGGHVPNERFNVEEIVQTACLYAAVAFDFLGKGAER
ncbi:MAG: M20/M25/M40 family metallo-hydrolase [Deltaproteobacteria bacterium]|nr:M20/M25/M40 family metallo-hydrolase [Deltaproteobacteria bacterium]